MRPCTRSAYVYGAVSDGCLNPAVTLALWVTRRLDSARAVALIAVQLIGAAFAGGVLVAVSQDSLTKAYAGTPHLQSFRETADQTISASDWALGSLTESVLTFLLTLALLATVLRQDRPRWGAAAAGLALMAAVLAGYH